MASNALHPDLLGPAPSGTPLYVHFPYCAAKCHYCDFYSLADDGADQGAVVDLLLAEARARAPRAPRTLFLGGGTPSLLRARELERLLAGLQEVTGYRSSAEEVTVEANPESLDLEKARLLRSHGVTRLSLGFQSLRKSVLELFGRVHGVEQAFRAYQAARDAGLPEVNVDLIYAAPGHSLAEWGSDLERVLDLAPDHLSAYNLAFEEDTLFRRWLAEGRIAKVPDELEMELFFLTRERLRERGYVSYEISNHALPGRECRHNLNYWRNGPYLGIGPSAASRIGRARGGNVRDLAGWSRSIAAARPALDWSESLPWAERLGECWWLGLRLAEGLEPAEARERADCRSLPAREDPSLPLIERLAQQGHLVARGQRWCIPEDSLPLADAIAARFLNDLPRHPRAAFPLAASEDPEAAL